MLIEGEVIFPREEYINWLHSNYSWYEQHYAGWTGFEYIFRLFISQLLNKKSHECEWEQEETKEGENILYVISSTY